MWPAQLRRDRYMGRFVSNGLYGIAWQDSLKIVILEGTICTIYMQFIGPKKPVSEGVDKLYLIAAAGLGLARRLLGASPA